MGASRRAYWHSWAVTLNFEAPDEKAAESPRGGQILDAQRVAAQAAARAGATLSLSHTIAVDHQRLAQRISLPSRFQRRLGNNMAGRMPPLVRTLTNWYSLGDSSCRHLAKDSERQVRPFCLA